jgi:hypothetical protein
MYVNEKMKPAETIPRLGGIKKNDRGVEFNYDIL